MEKKFDKEEFRRSIIYTLKSQFRKKVADATPQEVYQAVAYAVKDIIVDDWIATHKEYEKEDSKTLYYLSMEFLMGRALGNNIINLMDYEPIKETLDEMGFDLNVLEDQEPDAALGNGGLGRLAACFLDSLATLGYPAYGCGIRYRYGMFKQKIEDGYQVEVPDEWLKDGNPFEIRRSEYATEVKFGGYVKHIWEDGKEKYVQEGYESVMAVPYDLPIVGYGNHVVNTLRIWDAQPINMFNLDSFDKGDYQKAVEQENLAKNICEVLYPNDNHYAGKELRLKQQYFFISASVQRAVQKFKEKHDDQQAIQHFKLAILKEDEEQSLYQLALYGEQGIEVSKEEMLDYLLRSAKKGYSPALVKYAYYLENGIYVEKDYQMAYEYYLLACQKQNREGFYHLGRWFFYGIGQKEDKHKAMQYYQQASHYHYSKASFMLGYMYHYGDGISKDLEKAKEYYQLALQEGYLEAQKELDKLEVEK